MQQFQRPHDVGEARRVAGFVEAIDQLEGAEHRTRRHPLHLARCGGRRHAVNGRFPLDFGVGQVGTEGEQVGGAVFAQHHIAHQQAGGAGGFEFAGDAEHLADFAGAVVGQSLADMNPDTLADREVLRATGELFAEGAQLAAQRRTGDVGPACEGVADHLIVYAADAEGSGRAADMQAAFQLNVAGEEDAPQ